MKGELVIRCFLSFTFGLTSSTLCTHIVEDAFCQEPGTGITGSAHDLSIATGHGSDYGQTDSLDRICIFCHAPHHTMEEGDATNILYLPLWNHEVTTEDHFTLYQSDFGEGPSASGLDGAGESGADDQFVDRHLLNAAETLDQPSSVSLLCLSCHDGTIAVNAYGFEPSASIGGNNSFIGGSFLIGGSGNLSNHHPIGFDYAGVRAYDDEIVDESHRFGSTDVTIISVLDNGKMACYTCHDVHNSKNEGESLLWTSDRNNEFCCTCHLKCN